MKRDPYFIILLGCMFLMLGSREAPAQNSRPGRIIGHIDGISQGGDHYFLLGWACQQGQTKSIADHLFAEQVQNGYQRSRFSRKPEPIQRAWRGRGLPRLGKQETPLPIVLPHSHGRESRLSIHGIRIVDGVPNDLIAGSGAKLALKPLDPPSASLP